jgi:hypothetical protein
VDLVVSGRLTTKNAWICPSISGRRPKTRGFGHPRAAYDQKHVFLIISTLLATQSTLERFFPARQRRLRPVAKLLLPLKLAIYV